MSQAILSSQQPQQPRHSIDIAIDRRSLLLPINLRLLNVVIGRLGNGTLCTTIAVGILHRLITKEGLLRKDQLCSVIANVQSHLSSPLSPLGTDAKKLVRLMLREIVERSRPALLKRVVSLPSTSATQNFSKALESHLRSAATLEVRVQLCLLGLFHSELAPQCARILLSDITTLSRVAGKITTPCIAETCKSAAVIHRLLGDFANSHTCSSLAQEIPPLLMRIPSNTPLS